MVLGEVGEIRKGPWTEQEDLQLVWFVRLLGERRWDFLAKVSGLNRTGKSCRLRWVNYLHPGLKHGRMTPEEEQLVLDLHEKYGNRWAKIASKLPGRTDNEIKNYWRTHMRKKAQEEKGSSSSPSSSSMSQNNESQSESAGITDVEETTNGYSNDQLWQVEMASKLGFEEYNELGCYSNSMPINSMPSPVWEYNPEPLWMMDDHVEFKQEY
ncbi:transcription factor MYB59-like [Carex rostrata]